MNDIVAMRGQLQAYLQCVVPEYSSFLIQALSMPGKLFSYTDRPRPGFWACYCETLAYEIVAEPLTLLQQQVVRQTALAVECFICALDILDDIEDGEASPYLRCLGIDRHPAHALTQARRAAMLLLTFVVPGLFFSLREHQHADGLIDELLNVIQLATLRAAGGQHLDLVWETWSNDQLTRDQIVAMMMLKSGSLTSMATLLAALAVNIADPELLKKCKAAGVYLGLREQTRNDRSDHYNTKKSDIWRGKKTLFSFLSSRYGNKQAENMILAYNQHFHSMLTELIHAIETQQRISFVHLRSILELPKAEGTGEGTLMP